MCMITSGHTRATAAEEDAVREQQLKQTQSGAAAEVNAVGEQELMGVAT